MVLDCNIIVPQVPPMLTSVSFALNLHQHLQPINLCIYSYYICPHYHCSLPSNSRLRPSVANGHLGTVVHSPSVFMNGLYNGYMTDSHRAVVPSTCSLNVTGTEPESKFKRKYRLNVGEGQNYIVTFLIILHIVIASEI